MWLWDVTIYHKYNQGTSYVSFIVLFQKFGQQLPHYLSGSHTIRFFATYSPCTHTITWLKLQNLNSSWIYMYLFSHSIGYHDLSYCYVHCSWNNIQIPIHGVYNTHPMHCKLLLKPPVTDCITQSCNDFAWFHTPVIKNYCIPV